MQKKKKVRKSNLKQLKKHTNEWDLYQVFKASSAFKEKEISIIHYINRLKKEKHMMICTDIEALEKIQC